jgi:hypothetical protein
MRVVETLHKFENSSSALIEVEAEEIADFDTMMALVDGSGGDYSIDARLVSTLTPPKIEVVGDHRLPLRQRKFSTPSDIRHLKRYYEVRLNRIEA